MSLQNRKSNRLKNFDYNLNSAYFITVCTKDRKHILSKINVGTPVPTQDTIKIDNKNSIVSKFVSTFKRFCNKDYGYNIWQSRYYDHIIRNRNDYNEIWKYIENNPQKLLLTGKTQND